MSLNVVPNATFFPKIPVSVTPSLDGDKEYLNIRGLLGQGGSAKVILNEKECYLEIRDVSITDDDWKKIEGDRCRIPSAKISGRRFPKKDVGSCIRKGLGRVGEFGAKITIVNGIKRIELGSREEFLIKTGMMKSTPKPVEASGVKFPVMSKKMEEEIATTALGQTIKKIDRENLADSIKALVKTLVARHPEVELAISQDKELIIKVPL